MFKKSMAALAVLSLSAGLASASEVTLYGIVDNGLLYKHSKVETNGVSTKTDSFALESGISSPSRFGIKGSEDLGNGMTVSFKLENGFNADDGSFGDDRLFNRESSLTLSGDFGKLSFGRMGAIGSAAGDFDAAFAIGDAFDCFKLPKWNVFSLKSERGLLAPPSGFIPRKVLASKLGGGLNQRSP